MRFILSIALSFFAFTSTSLAQEVIDGTYKRYILERTVNFLQKKNDHDVIYDLKNILRFREFEEGQSYGSDDTVTLRKFDCQTWNTNGFQCQLAVQYCFARNEYPPSLSEISISSPTDFKHIQIQKSTRPLPLDFCHESQ